MTTQRKWYAAKIVAVSEQLPPVCGIGKVVAVSLATCGVRVWGAGMAPRVLTLAEGGIEAAWSRWFSGARG